MPSYISSNSYEASSGTLPTHSTGNLILAYASGATEPTLPTGWTQAGSTFSSGGRVDKIGYKVAASASETSGTWTNANRLVFAVYADATAGSASFDDNGFANTINYPTLTLTETGGTSWVAGFYNTGSNNWDTTGIEPAGTTTRLNGNGGDSVGLIDTNGGVSSWSSVSSGAQPNTTNANAAVIELVATPTSETATTGNVPLVIQSGYTLVDLVDPVTTNASLLFGFTGETPVTGDDLEYDVTSTLDSGVTLSNVAANGVWTVTEAVDGDWLTDIVIDRRVVQANGTIGTTAAITLSAATGGSTIPAEDRTNLNTIAAYLVSTGNYTAVQTNDILAEWLEGAGYSTQFNTALFNYLGGLGYTGSLADRYYAWKTDA